MNYKIYIINMDRSTERLEKMQARFKELNLGFERIVGVNASQMPVKELYERYSIQKSISDFYRPLHLGEIGCYISHQNAWKKIIEDNVDFGIVLEDDVGIKDNFEEAINFASKNLGKWQFLRLQHETKPKKIYNIDYKDCDFSLVEYIKTTGGFIGYALKKEIAKTLLQELVPFGITADTNAHLYNKYAIEVKALRPYLIDSSFEHFSDNSSFTPQKTLKFSKFARTKFSIKSYLTRIKYLLKRDGFLKFSFRLLNMLFSKTIRD